MRCLRSSRLCRASIAARPLPRLPRRCSRCFELGDLDRLARRQRGGRRLDPGQQVGGRGDDSGAGPVDLARQLGKRSASFGELWVGGEQPGTREVAAGGDGGLAGGLGFGALGDEAFGEHGSRDRSELDTHTPGGDRHEIDRNEVGKHDEVGGRGRLLDRLQQAPSADGVEQVELVKDEDLAVALHRGEGCLADDLGGLLGGDRRPDAHYLANIGMLARQRQPRVTRSGVLAAGQQEGGKGAGGLVFGGARWSDEEVGVNG